LLTLFYFILFCIQLIMRSTNPREVGLIFKGYARSIHAKTSPADPNFLRLSVACAKIEHWVERNYPSFVRLPPPDSSISNGVVFDSSDARSRVAITEAEADRRAAEEKRKLEIRERIVAGGAAATTNGVSSYASAAQNQGPPWEVLAFVAAAVFLVVALSVGIVLAVVHFTA
jgi:farnesyl-diphosphate farnesyltransferase